MEMETYKNIGARQASSNPIDELQGQSLQLLESSKFQEAQSLLKNIGNISLPSVNENSSVSTRKKFGETEDSLRLYLLKLDVADRLAKQFIKTKLFGFKTEAGIFSCIIIGYDEGKEPTEALRDYCELSDGSLAKYASAFLKDFQNFGGKYQILENTDKIAKIKFFFNGSIYVSSYTIEEAKTANLLRKNNWINYRADMLFARCAVRGVRRICPQSTGGFYLPEEKGASVDRDGVPLEDSLNSRRTIRNSPSIQNGENPVTIAKAKPRMSPEQIKQWCITKAKIINEAFISSKTEEELLSVLDKNSKTLQNIKRGYKPAAARLKQVFGEMQVAIKAKESVINDDFLGLPEDDLDKAIIKDNPQEDQDNMTVDGFSLDDIPFL